jgi:hypothetical protein
MSSVLADSSQQKVPRRGNPLREHLGKYWPKITLQQVKKLTHSVTIFGHLPKFTYKKVKQSHNTPRRRLGGEEL